MLPTLIELVAAPLLAAAATLAARRWGPRAGGVMSAFPAIVGPVLLITALEHGAAFTARAANGTLFGLVALSGFAFSYGKAAVRRRWPSSLAAGWLAAAVAALAVGRLAGGAGAPTGLLVATVSLWLAHRGLHGGGRLGGRRGGGRPAGGSRGDGRLGAPRGDGRLGAPRGGGRPPGSPQGPAPLDQAPLDQAPPRHDLATRMILTALLVFALATATGAVGPLVGGMLAALPVLASMLAVFAHREHGGAAAAALLGGALAGMAGFVAFVEAVAVLIVPAGLAPAFAGATIVAVIVQTMAMRAPLSARSGVASPRSTTA